MVAWNESKGLFPKFNSIRYKFVNGISKFQFEITFVNNCLFFSIALKLKSSYKILPEEELSLFRIFFLSKRKLSRSNIYRKRYCYSLYLYFVITHKITTVKLGYNELGYNEHSVITNTRL